MRIFYGVKAAFEKNTNVYKIGISERGEHAAKGRLIDYVYSYGIADKNNTCKGVKIYLVLANYFNPDVEEQWFCLFDIPCVPYQPNPTSF